MVTIPELRSAYTTLNSRLVRNAGEFARRIYSGLGSWRDEDVERYRSLVNPTVDGLKIQAARVQAAYYQQMAQLAGQDFQAVPVPPRDLTDTVLRNGADPVEVYRRPFVSTYTAISEGKSITEAVLAGAARAFSIASTDVQLAGRYAGLQQRGRNDNIVGYRRVLSGAENCALCAIASTQRYRKNNLKPIHPGCDCGEEPIYGDFDPGQVIDQDTLDAVREGVLNELGVFDAGARSAGLNKVTASGQPISDWTEIIVTREHGEYGPTIAWRNQKFTGPSDLPMALDN
jgi:hypothetical protein